MRTNRTFLAIAACIFPLAFVPSPLLAVSTVGRVVDLVNIERAKAGVPPVKINPRLTESARRYALYLGKSRFFGHVAPDGSTLVTRNCGAGYENAVWLGENIAAGYFSPEAAVAAWMESPAHRSNILDPNFAEIGVATVRVSGSRYAQYWVQEFGRRKNWVLDDYQPSEKLRRKVGQAQVFKVGRRKGVVSSAGHPGPPAAVCSDPSGARPCVTGVSPSTSPRGAVVTVTGRGFGSSGVLRFGGLEARTLSWTDTTIRGRVPNGAISAGVTVANDAGFISRGVGFRVDRAYPAR